MKYFFIILTLILLGCHTADINFNKTGDQNTSQVNQTIFKGSIEYKASLIDLRNSIFKLIEAAKNEAITTEFEECLLAFHNIGFLMEYYDNGLYNLMNGAPVYKEDHSTPGAEVNSPHGFQVIAELLADDVVDYKSILEEVQFMKRQSDYYSSSINRLRIEEESMINAAAILLIRMETLTITDFENNGEALSAKVFDAQIKSIHHYLEHIVTDSLLLELPNMLANYDDKLSLVLYINQYKEIITQLNNVIIGFSPVNYKVTNIYDENFLEASFYGNFGINSANQSDKIELGEMLFNDPQLSHNQSFSCATCHQSNQFFTDGLKLSNSNLAGTSLKRNTPSAIHTAYQSKYMYDGRAASLEDQMLHVFNNPKEFESSTTEIVKRISNDSNYQTLFSKLYPNMLPNAINLNSLTDALATYVRSLTAHQTSFDKYMRGELLDLSPSTLNGFNLFMGKAKCGTCHFAPTFSGLSPPFYKESELENLGVPSIDENGNWIIDADLGRYDFFPNIVFKHFFKTPTLRNVAMTAPYMHNGVFQTLEEVMEFYNNGGGVGHNLNYTNQTLPTDSLGLSQQEIKDIILFMEALTDSTYVTN